MITLRFNENRVSRAIAREVRLSEVSQDTSGVTLHFRWYETDKQYSRDEASVAREVLKKVFPDNAIDTMQARITLGQFIDVFDRII